MKIYLFSDVSGGGDEITEALDRANVNIIAKEAKMDVDAVGRNIEKLMEESAPNLFVFVTDSSVEAGIDLNKRKNIRAAVCNSYEDVANAKKQNANVIIVQDICAKKPEIAEAMIGGQPFSRVLNIMKSNKKRNEEVGEEAHVEVKKAKKVEENEESDDFEDNEPTEKDTHKNRKGIMGKLKDSLGIMD